MFYPSLCLPSRETFIKMTLKNIFLFPVLWLSGKEAGTQRHRATLSVEKLGRQGAAQCGAQVSAGRAMLGRLDLPAVHVGRWFFPFLSILAPQATGCFPSRESQAECQLIRNSFAASWSPGRVEWGWACWRHWALGGGRACER